MLHLTTVLTIKSFIIVVNDQEHLILGSLKKSSKDQTMSSISFKEIARHLWKSFAYCIVFLVVER